MDSYIRYTHIYIYIYTSIHLEVLYIVLHTWKVLVLGLLGLGLHLGQTRSVGDSKDTASNIPTVQGPQFEETNTQI